MIHGQQAKRSLIIRIHLHVLHIVTGSYSVKEGKREEEKQGQKERSQPHKQEEEKDAVTACQHGTPPKK